MEKIISTGQVLNTLKLLNNKKGGMKWITLGLSILLIGA